MIGMANPDLQRGYLDRLRQWRNRPDFDFSLNFLKGQFEREVQRPYKQLSTIAQIWESLVPEDLAQHTKIESLSRGVLLVSVNSSARLYQLDRLLRGGLQRQLITQHRGPAFRRVKLRLEHLA